MHVFGVLSYGASKAPLRELMGHDQKSLEWDAVSTEGAQPLSHRASLEWRIDTARGTEEIGHCKPRSRHKR